MNRAVPEYLISPLLSAEFMWPLVAGLRWETLDSDQQRLVTGHLSISTIDRLARTDAIEARLHDRAALTNKGKAAYQQLIRLLREMNREDVNAHRFELVALRLRVMVQLAHECRPVLVSRAKMPATRRRAEHGGLLLKEDEAHCQAARAGLQEMISSR